MIGAVARNLDPISFDELTDIAKHSPPQRMPRTRKNTRPKRAETIPANPPQGKAIRA